MEVDHADDAVQGGADFVAHAGEELAFGFAGGLGGQARFLIFSGALDVGDVEGDALKKDRPAFVIADDLAFALDPYDVAVAGEQAVFGAEVGAGGAGAGEFGDPAFAVVGMELAEPEEGIVEPFFLGEAEERFDLRADVEFLLGFVEAGHEGDDGEAFDEGAVAEIRLPAFARGVGAGSRAVFNDVVRGGGDGALAEAGHFLKEGDGFVFFHESCGHEMGSRGSYRS